MELAALKGRIDFGIITIRPDELTAVLDRLPKLGKTSGRREYNIRSVDLDGGGAYLVAVVRCLEQGTGEAQAAAHDLIADLAPRWILLVGIGGAIPSDALWLGDVAVSTRVYDFTVEARRQDRAPEYSLTGGRLHPGAERIVANIAALDEEISGWNESASIKIDRPAMDAKVEFYGSESWQGKVREALAGHAGQQEPLFVCGPVASSDRLLKDADLPDAWLPTVRHLLAAEMEMAGAYRAAHAEQIPIITIRGISDVIGLKRDERWTPYACNTAAAFTLAFLRTKPIPPKDNHDLLP